MEQIEAKKGLNLLELLAYTQHRYDLTSHPAWIFLFGVR